MNDNIYVVHYLSIHWDKADEKNDRRGGYTISRI